MDKDISLSVDGSYRANIRLLIPRTTRVLFSANRLFRRHKKLVGSLISRLRLEEVFLDSYGP